MKIENLKILIKNVYWWIYGGPIYNPPFPSHIKSMLFICKGNICRSIFAEIIAENKYNISKQYIIHSAGILVDEPISPPAAAIATAKDFGVDMLTHRSRQMNYKLMETFDMIFVMEAWQYKYLRKLFIEFKTKVFLLPLLETDRSRNRNSYSMYNIKDPYGKGAQEFNECYKRIESCIDTLFLILDNNNNTNNWPAR